MSFETDENEMWAAIKEARSPGQSRGYADFFGWTIDRDLEEWGAANTLQEALKKDGTVLFSDLKRRGRGNDPPDCEALGPTGKRIAIEVTELVDGNFVPIFQRTPPEQQSNVFADWGYEKFISAMAKRIEDKAGRFPKLKDPPYDGGYIVLVYSSEPLLSAAAVIKMLKDHKFNNLGHPIRAFLLLKYDPSIKRYPYFELNFES
jgi:hypothetical protein